MYKMMIEKNGQVKDAHMYRISCRGNNCARKDENEDCTVIFAVESPRKAQILFDNTLFCPFYGEDLIESLKKRVTSK